MCIYVCVEQAAALFPACVVPEIVPIEHFLDVVRAKDVTDNILIRVEPPSVRVAGSLALFVESVESPIFLRNEMEGLRPENPTEFQTAIENIDEGLDRLEAADGKLRNLGLAPFFCRCYST